MNEQDSRKVYIWWVVYCFLSAVVLALWLNGCHTVHGIGQDLKDMTSDYVEREP